MSTILAHAGHSHGPDPSLIALLAVVAVVVTLGFVAAIRARGR